MPYDNPAWRVITEKIQNVDAAFSYTVIEVTSRHPVALSLKLNDIVKLRGKEYQINAINTNSGFDSTEIWFRAYSGESKIGGMEPQWIMPGRRYDLDELAKSVENDIVCPEVEYNEMGWGITPDFKHLVFREPLGEAGLKNIAEKIGIIAAYAEGIWAAGIKIWDRKSGMLIKPMSANEAASVKRAYRKTTIWSELGEENIAAYSEPMTEASKKLAQRAAKEVSRIMDEQQKPASKTAALRAAKSGISHNPLVPKQRRIALDDE